MTPQIGTGLLRSVPTPPDLAAPRHGGLAASLEASSQLCSCRLDSVNFRSTPCAPAVALAVDQPVARRHQVGCRGRRGGEASRRRYYLSNASCGLPRSSSPSAGFVPSTWAPPPTNPTHPPRRQLSPSPLTRAVAARRMAVVQRLRHAVQLRLAHPKAGVAGLQLGGRQLRPALPILQLALQVPCSSGQGGSGVVCGSEALLTAAPVCCPAPARALAPPSRGAARGGCQRANHTELAGCQDCLQACSASLARMPRHAALGVCPHHWHCWQQPGRSRRS